jgi:hypothetical protein
VLAVVGSSLPSQLRAFLLTLAVVEDLIVIVIIAVFCTAAVHPLPLPAALALLAVYAVLQRLRVETFLVYVPLGAATWSFTHESGAPPPGASSTGCPSRLRRGGPVLRAALGRCHAHRPGRPRPRPPQPGA